MFRKIEKAWEIKLQDDTLFTSIHMFDTIITME